MSISVMNLVWQNAPYQGNTLVALLALADWSNDDGISWPALKTLARKSRQSARHLQRVLHRMEQDGVIAITERHGNSSVYRINIHRLEGTPKCPTRQKKHRGATSCPKRQDKMSPNTSIEPSVEATINTGTVFQTGILKLKPRATA